MILLLFGTLVLQRGDTLFFTQDIAYLDTVVMQEYLTDGVKARHCVMKAKVSPDGKTYMIYYAYYTATTPETLLTSAVSFYDADKRTLLEERAEGERSLSYDLSGVHDSLLVIATWERQYHEPAVSVVNGGKRQQVVKKGEWERIVSYVISNSGRYFLFHTRNPYYDRLWDYIYFYDLETGDNWEYLFPNCPSCKKSRIELEIDDSGWSEVINRQEHRVFSSGGVLENIYLQP